MDYIDETLINDTTKIESEVILDDFQMSIVKRIEDTDESLFLSGKAGTGKSAIIKHIFNHTKKKVVLLAPTGIAAINIGGQTIHSFFKLKIDEWTMSPKDAIKRLENDLFIDEFKKKIEKTDLIIIDEISMVRVDLFNTIDYLCRYLREEPDKLFGGIQLLVVGDMLQLPPVIREPLVKNGTSRTPIRDTLRKRYGGEYFFYAKDATKINLVKLTNVYRQDDKLFVNTLNNIRTSTNLTEALKVINTRVGLPKDNEVFISLCSTNKEADKINKDELDKLVGKQKTYNATIEGTINQGDYPTEEHLKLKVGAHIMMLNNDPGHRWVNGSLGIIKSLEKGVFVEIEGNTYEVQQYTWESKTFKYNKRTDSIETLDKGSFTQYPIKLAWAITIHKSQGQTFESVFINLDRIFEKGQTYVALSRCRHLNTLYLNRPIRESDIIIDPRLNQFI